MSLNSVLLLSGVLLTSAVQAAAPPVKPNPAAVDAVAQVFLGPEPHRSRILAKSRQEFEAGALRAPRERRAANVLLTRGLTGVGVQSLLTPRGLDLVSFESKVPLPGPSNHMMTLWLGSRSLMFRGGSLEDLVDRAIGHERFRFLQLAQQMGNTPEVQDTVLEYRTVAMSPEFAVYRVEVVGTREALFSLLRDPAVYAVLVNEDEGAVTAFESEKAEMESAVIMRGPTIRVGPVDPHGPPPSPGAAPVTQENYRD